MLSDMINFIRHRAIKHLGQNFLTSKKTAEDIVNAADIGPEDIVLEAGPGRGVLTELLLKKAKKVIAVEKDERLVRFLETKFSDSIKMSVLSVICGDILKFNLGDYKPRLLNYKIVANIPYYITSRFLREFLSVDRQPSSMVLMVQKEVAERITGTKSEAKGQFFRFHPSPSGGGLRRVSKFRLAPLFR